MAGQNLPDIPIYYQNDRLDNEFANLTEIGSGSFGQVYSALHRIDLKRYAIKKINIKDEDDYRLKIREIQIWAKLDCDYFVQYRSSWLAKVDGINLYVQMDLCWFTLKKAIEKLHIYFEIKDKELLPPLAYYIGSELMTEVVQCVEYLYSCNPPIMHRDINPVNILVKAEPRRNGRFLKLADFGLARFHETDLSEDSYSRFVGTLRYMAPEIQHNQSLNNPYKARYGPKVDIYSVGVVFQEMFNYDLNRRTLDPANFTEKYRNLEKLIDDMVSAHTKTRPVCRKILDSRNEWAIKFAEVSDEIRARVDPNRDYDINNEFILYFLQTKLKYQNLMNV